MESKAGFSFVAQIVLTQKHPDFLLDQRVLFLGFTRQSTGSLTVSEVFHRFFVRKHERAIRQKNPNLEISRPLDESWLQAMRSSLWSRQDLLVMLFPQLSGKPSAL